MRQHCHNRLWWTFDIHTMHLVCHWIRYMTGSLSIDTRHDIVDLRSNLQPEVFRWSCRFRFLTANYQLLPLLNFKKNEGSDWLLSFIVLLIGLLLLSIAVKKKIDWQTDFLHYKNKLQHGSQAPADSPKCDAISVTEDGQRGLFWLFPCLGQGCTTEAGFQELCHTNGQSPQFSSKSKRDFMVHLWARWYIYVHWRYTKGDCASKLV